MFNFFLLLFVIILCGTVEESLIKKIPTKEGETVGLSFLKPVLFNLNMKIIIFIDVISFITISTSAI